MDITEALFEKALAAGFSDGEVYYRRGRAFESHVFKSEVTEYKNSGFAGLSFRGTYTNGRMGYAYTERIAPESVELLVRQAAENAVIIEDEDIERLYHGDSGYAKADTYSEALCAVEQDAKIAAAMAMERAALGYDRRIKSVVHCAVGTAEDEVRIDNTYGLRLQHRRNFALAYIYPQAEENGRSKLSGEVWYGRDWAEFSPSALAEKAARRAIGYLNAESVASGRYGILFSNETAADLFKVYTGVFYADNVHKGFSLFKDKLGTVVASPVLSIRDDGMCACTLGCVAFDAEGVATRNKAVIENGELRTYLYTTKSAARDGVRPTGNGFKSGIHGAITTACTNFYVAPSTRSRMELIAGMADGIYVTELEGLHSGTNTVSGDFSLSAAGFLVEGGRLTRPVEQITIAGNFYRLLKDVTAVGSDLRFDMPGLMGTVGSPSVLVSGLDVAGT